MRLDTARIKRLRVHQEMEIKHYKSLNWIGPHSWNSHGSTVLLGYAEYSHIHWKGIKNFCQVKEIYRIFSFSWMPKVFLKLKDLILAKFKVPNIFVFFFDIIQIYTFVKWPILLSFSGMALNFASFLGALYCCPFLKCPIFSILIWPRFCPYLKCLRILSFSKMPQIFLSFLRFTSFLSILRYPRFSNIL